MGIQFGDTEITSVTYNETSIDTVTIRLVSKDDPTTILEEQTVFTKGVQPEEGSNSYLKAFPSFPTTITDFTFGYIDLSKLAISGEDSLNLFKKTSLQLSSNNEAITPEQRGVIWSIAGDNVSIDQTGLVTYTGDVDSFVEGNTQEVTVTLTSTYDSFVIRTYIITINKISSSYSLELNNGQWVNSGTTVDGFIVYKSDAGSYHINDGISRATITITGYTEFAVMIRSYAEPGCDFVVIGNLDQTGLVRYNSTCAGTTSNNQSSSTYTKITYSNITNGTHTIEIIYTKDGSVHSNDDRGYFYIPM